MHIYTKESVLQSALLELLNQAEVDINKTRRDKYSAERALTPDKERIRICDKIIDNRYNMIDVIDELLDDFDNGKIKIG